MSSIIDHGNMTPNCDGPASGPVVAPAYLQPSDFTLYNDTPMNLAKLQMALDEIQKNDPSGTAILKELWTQHKPIGINNYEAPSADMLAKMPPEVRDAYSKHPGEDMYVFKGEVVLWNPEAGTQVVDSSGKVVGVISAVPALEHEATHGIDPNVQDNSETATPGSYPNLAEWLAGQYEKISEGNLHEPVRTNHDGLVLRLNNPTAHTEVDAFGNTIWAQVNNEGKTETGPKYDFIKWEKVAFDPSVPPSIPAAPIFGTPVTAVATPSHAVDISDNGNLGFLQLMNDALFGGLSNAPAPLPGFDYTLPFEYTDEFPFGDGGLVDLFSILGVNLNDRGWGTVP